MLTQEFTMDTLHMLRETVLAHARAAGMPESRATDVMLVVHELAANAVCHGGGTGQLSLHIASGTLYCQVSDPGMDHADGQYSSAATSGPDPWPYRPGHGLWLVRQAADHFTAITGPRKSQVTVTFGLPSPS